MNEEMTVITLNDNKEYGILDKIVINDQKYLVLFDMVNPEHLEIVKYEKSAEKSYILDITEEEFNLVSKDFYLKHPELKSNV